MYHCEVPPLGVFVVAVFMMDFGFVFRHKDKSTVATSAFLGFEEFTLGRGDPWVLSSAGYPVVPVAIKRSCPIA